MRFRVFCGLAILFLHNHLAMAQGDLPRSMWEIADKWTCPIQDEIAVSKDNIQITSKNPGRLEIDFTDEKLIYSTESGARWISSITSKLGDGEGDTLHIGMPAPLLTVGTDTGAIFIAKRTRTFYRASPSFIGDAQVMYINRGTCSPR